MRARWMFLVCLAVPGLLNAAGLSARLTEPKGRISDNSPTFVWREVATATQYDLWVVNSNGAQISESVNPATGCADGQCRFTPAEPLEPGPHLWLVLSRVPASLDRWSNPKHFTVEPDGLRPGPVELVAPEDSIDSTSPSFSWRSAGAGFDYELVVLGRRTRTFFRQVYSDSQVCTGGVCTAPPSLTNLNLGDGAYTWSVRASGIVGPGPRSDKMRFNVRTLASPPLKPTLVSPQGRINETTPLFTWNKSDGASEYYLAIVSRGEVHGAWYPADATLCPHTTCSVAPSGLTLEHGRYGFSVIAKNASGESRPSRVMRFRVGDYLSTPVLIDPTGTTGTNPTFQWSAVPNAARYRMRVRTRGARMATLRFDARDICDASVCSATLSLALEEGTYKWLVVAYSDTIGRSSPSIEEVFQVVAGGDAPPATPESIAPQGTMDTKTPTFHWTNTPNATSYRLTVKDAFDPVLYSHTYTSGAALCSPTGGCKVTPVEMLEDGDYSFVVEAINAAGTSPASAVKNFTVAAGGGGAPPAMPEIVGPTGTVSQNTPTFQWRPVPAATSYWLKVKDEFDPVVYSYEYPSSVCAAICTAIPTDTLRDGRYTFFLYAKNGDVLGEPSRGEFTVDTSAMPPATTPLSPTGRVTDRNPAFTWSAVNEATAYTLVVIDAATAERHNMRYELVAVTCDASQCQVAPTLDLEDGSYSFTVITEDSLARTTPSDALAFTIAATPSTLRITSHNDGDTVADNGLIISGTVDSDTVSLTAQLDINSSPAMGARPVEISINNGWSVFLLPSQLTPGPGTLTLVGTDSSGGTSTLSLNITVAAFDRKEAMLLSRATFGATPALLDEVKSGGATALQDRLLNPTPDATFDAFVASLPTSTDDDVREYALSHALFSPNALQEVMTQFWDNHFSTSMSSHDVPEYELRENNDFRANALGRFRDLLSISAKSPAMSIYLDLTNNSVVEPNENYSREVLELSTMGVDGGYTQDDIEELARILTGWKEVGGNFEFVPSDHDTGTKFFLGVEFPAAAGSIGLAEGELVLDMLSEHRSTAEFICTKLIELLITEAPPVGLVAGCADVFQAEHLNGNPNQIRDVLQYLFDSSEFVDPVNFHAKVKTPLELLASTVRHLDATVEDRGDLDGDLRSDLGMYLFRNPSPDGFSETADDWVDTSLLLARVDFVNEVARETAERDTYVDIRAYFVNKGFETAEGIVGYLFEIAFQNEFSPVELSIAYDILSGRGTSQFDINSADAEARLRQLVGTVLSFPGYQHQ